jgi:hypothetical protein
MIEEQKPPLRKTPVVGSSFSGLSNFRSLFNGLHRRNETLSR